MPFNEISFEKVNKFNNSTFDSTKSECFCVRFSKSDLFLAAAYSTGKICVFDCNNFYKHQCTIRVSDYAVTSLRFRGDSSILATSAEGKITSWHAKTGKILNTIEDPKNPLMCLDLNAHLNLFAVGGNDKVVKLFDDETKTLVRELKGNYNQIGHSNRIFSVNFNSTNPNLLVSGGWDSIVVFYDVRTKEIINSVLGAHICGDALDMQDYQLLTGSWRVKEQIKIFDIRKFSVLETVNWEYNSDNHTSYLYSAQFSKKTSNNYFAVGGSQINQYRVYDNSTHCLKNEKTNEMDRSVFCFEEGLSGPVYSIDFSNTMNNLVTFGCGDGVVRIYQIK